MDAIVLIVSVLVNGLIIGAFGRLLLPGRDPISLPGTIGIGVVASLLGGFVTYLLFEETEWVALALSVAFAVAIVWLVRAMRGGDDERVTLPSGALDE